MDELKSRHYERFFEASSDAQLIIRQDYIHGCNNHAVKLFNLESEDELIGKSPFDFSPEYQPNGEKSSVMGKNFLNEVEITGSARFEWLHDAGTSFLWTEYILDHVSDDGDEYLLAIIRDISDYKIQQQKFSDRIERLIVQNQALAELSASESATDFTLELFNESLTRTAVEALDVDAVGIWGFKGKYKIKRKYHYHKRSGNHYGLDKLDLRKYPRLEKAIMERQPIVAGDAFRDPRTNELSPVFKDKERRKHALIIVPIINDAIIQGLIWIEKEYEIRKWQFEEQSFAVSLAAMISKQVGTALKQTAERKLEKHEKMFKALIEHSLDVVCIIDSKGTFTYQSPSFRKVLGYDKHELEGKRSFDLIHQEDARTLKLRYIKLLATPGSEDSFTYRALHKNGKWIYIEALASNRLHDREIDGIVINFRDVTGKQTTESALIESQMRLEGIVSSALDAIITIDSDLNIVLFNPAAEKMFKYPAFEIFGKSFEILFPKPARKEQRQFVQTFGRSASREPLKLEATKGEERLLGRRFDGSSFPMDGSVSKQEIEDEMFYTAIVRDISEQIKSEQVLKEYSKTLEHEVDVRTNQLHTKNKELNKTLKDLRDTQEQLVESEKMASLGQLTAGIAHEINNPINFVSSTITPLKRDFEEVKDIINQRIKKATNGKQKEEMVFLFTEIQSLLNGIEEGAKRTKDIVLGLRKFSRLDEDTFKKVDLHEGLDSTLMLLNSMIRGKIEVVKKYGDIPMVECLPGKINQVFMNILSNAIQSIKKKGIITIETKVRGKTITIIIRDTGVGMNKEVKNRIFEPFFTTKDVGIGTGMGLSISYGIVENHNGKISVQSSPGKGSKFAISLPVSQL